MKRTSLLFILLVIFSYASFAQAILTRSGSFTYVAPTDQSLEQAKKTALELAKLSIIEEEFGTVVGVSSISRTSNIDGKSSSSFLSIGETEVKGEWISTVGTPSFEMSFQGESMVINVSVTGQIRELKSSSVALDVKILRNGIGERFESDVLRNGDDFFISFKTPVKGYIAVYQYDNDGVFRLLPYCGSEAASIPVKAGKEYVFFDDKSRDGVALRSDIDGSINPDSHYTIVCNTTEDLCRYYVIFSSNAFSLANDGESVNSVWQMDFDSFQKWLGKVRKQDSEMTVVCRDITLKR